jgi:hypothetical protein
MLIRRSVGRKVPVPVRALRICYRAPDKLGHRPQYLNNAQENVSRVSEPG